MIVNQKTSANLSEYLLEGLEPHRPRSRITTEATHRHFAVVVRILQECLFQATLHVGRAFRFEPDTASFCASCGVWRCISLDRLNDELKRPYEVNTIPQIGEVVSLKPI